MVRVLQVPAHLYTGGVEKVARDIGMYADSEEYQVDYIVFDKEEGNYEPELREHGCRIFRLREPSEDYRAFLRDLKKIMTETHYDVVHAHTMFNIGWIMMVARQMRVPVRVAHAHSALTNHGGLKVKLYEEVMRGLILHNATDLVACGEKAGIRLFGEKAYRKEGNLILNGVDVDRFCYDPEKGAAIRKQWSLDDSFVIGHAGHLAEVKNQKYLIDLMPEILKRKPDAKLLLLGEGPDREILERRIRELDLTERVILTGNVPNVGDYLSAMDVFAFPSLYEGMPLSVIEVQANGLPCILSTGVPKDVYLTDLISALPLDDREKWVEMICAAERREPMRYAEALEHSGFNSRLVMEKIYQIYEGNK